MDLRQQLDVAGSDVDKARATIAALQEQLTAAMEDLIVTEERYEDLKRQVDTGEGRHVDNLPPDVLSKILVHLSPRDRAVCRLVHRRWADNIPPLPVPQRSTAYFDPSDCSFCQCSPDGRWLASCHSSKGGPARAQFNMATGRMHRSIIRVWNLTDLSKPNAPLELVLTGMGQATPASELDFHRFFGLTSCAFSPDGRRLVAGSHYDYLKVWSTETWQEECVLWDDSDEIGSEEMAVVCGTRCPLTFSPQGHLLVQAGTLHGTLRVRGVGEGWKKVAVLDHEKVDISQGQDEADDHSTAFTPSGALLASAFMRSVKLWCTATWQLQGHVRCGAYFATPGNLSCCAFTASGRQLVLGSSVDAALAVWPVARLTQPSAALASAPPGGSSGHAGSPAAGGEEAVVWLKGRANASTPVRCCSVSPDGLLLVAGHAKEGFAKVWCTRSWCEVAHLKHTASLQACSFAHRAVPDHDRPPSGQVDGAAAAGAAARALVLACGATDGVIILRRNVPSYPDALRNALRTPTGSA